jgi:hypothetical protein
MEQSLTDEAAEGRRELVGNANKALEMLRKSGAQISGSEQPDLIHGVRAIAHDLNLPVRKTYHLLAQGLIPGSFRLGKTWSMSRRANRAEIAEMAAGRGTAKRRS